MNDRCGGCNVGENKWLGVYGLTLEYVQDVHISNKISILYNEPERSDINWSFR